MAALTPCKARPIVCNGQGVLMPAGHPLHLAVPKGSNALGRGLGRVHELHGGCRCAGRGGLKRTMLSTAGHSPDRAGQAAPEERQPRDAPGIKIDHRYYASTRTGSQRLKQCIPYHSGQHDTPCAGLHPPRQCNYCLKGHTWQQACPFTGQGM